jgi:hypothetical protein
LSIRDRWSEAMKGYKTEATAYTRAAIRARLRALAAARRIERLRAQAEQRTAA